MQAPAYWARYILYLRPKVAAISGSYKPRRNPLSDNGLARSSCNCTPLFQKLHVHGGQLSGVVDIHMGAGLAGVIGTAPARTLCIPAKSASHEFTVDIFHAADGLHWYRRFDGETPMRSLVVPVGHLPDGYWIEINGPIRMARTVNVLYGGWY